MIDKIDRPDVPSHYRITESKHATDDQHQGRQPQEDADAHYEQEEAQTTWEKFHRAELSVKWAKVAANRISKCLYQDAASRQGSPFLMTDIFWTNGTTTSNALLLLQRLDDVLKLKQLKRGNEVPREFWSYRDEIEVGILQPTGQSGLHRLHQKTTSSHEKNIENRNQKTDQRKSYSLGTIAALIFVLIIVTLILIQSF